MSYTFDSDRFNITQDHYNARDFVQDFSEKLHSRSYSDPSYKFNDLYKYLLDYRTIQYAYHLTKRKNSCAGIDRQSFSEINEKDLIISILRDLHRRKYRPNYNLVIRKVEDGGKTRKLSIPTIRDRVLQRAVTFLLNAVFEPAFHKFAYAYRPKITPQDAIYSIIDNLKKGWTTVFDADIESCFDNLQPALVLKTLCQKVEDQDLVRLINMILMAPSSYKGKVQKPQGLAQGGTTSPLFSNMAMNHFDDFFYQNQINKFAGLVRYSDDFVVMTDHRNQELFDIITDYLHDEMRLRLNTTKTKTINMRLGTPLKFLGYMINIERVKPLQLVIQPKRKNIERIKSSITKLLEEEADHKEIRSQLTSFYSYYSICNNPEIFEEINNHARAGGYNLETIF